MNLIYKYPLKEGGLDVPLEAKFIHVGKDAYGAPSIWAEFKAENTNYLIEKKINIVETGVPFSKSQTPNYIGTVLDDVYIWHVYTD